MGETNVYRIFMGKTSWKLLLRRSRMRWYGNVMTEVRVTDSVDWTWVKVAHDPLV